MPSSRLTSPAAMLAATARRSASPARGLARSLRLTRSLVAGERQSLSAVPRPSRIAGVAQLFAWTAKIESSTSELVPPAVRSTSLCLDLTDPIAELEVFGFVAPAGPVGSGDGGGVRGHEGLPLERSRRYPDSSYAVSCGSQLGCSSRALGGARRQIRRWTVASVSMPRRAWICSRGMRRTRRPSWKRTRDDPSSSSRYTDGRVTTDELGRPR